MLEFDRLMSLLRGVIPMNELTLDTMGHHYKCLGTRHNRGQNVRDEALRLQQDLRDFKSILELQLEATMAIYDHVVEDKVSAALMLQDHIDNKKPGHETLSPEEKKYVKDQIAGGFPFIKASEEQFDEKCIKAFLRLRTNATDLEGYVQKVLDGQQAP